MRFSIQLSSALLIGIAAAVPATTTGVASQSLNTTRSENTTAADAGPESDFKDMNPFNITATETTEDRVSHSICWSKVPDNMFLNWTNFKANGANLGGWLEKEKTHDPIWWASVGDGVAADAQDEWTLCELLGDECGPALEARYTDFLNKTTIDQLASVGVNTLRIPTTYAAWVDVPGSSFYYGKQQEHLREISLYAIEEYSMHVIIGLHSLPGGVNNLDIGEGLMHDAWFYNDTNMEYSWQAVDEVLTFMKNSGHLNAFTIAPINEASDNLSSFGSAAGLTDNATNWILSYMDGVFERVEAVDKRIPVMLQDCFKGASFWAPLFETTRNLVIDSHVYYFAASGTYSQWVNPAVCGQAAYIAEETSFPVFVGEWALQVMYNNTFDGRKTIFDTQRYAWQKYVAGGAFWTAVSYATAEVDGEGVQRDYWSYIDLINDGVITSATNSSYC
ncbi:glycoside hydrolase superfamily [Truncatella angustata]|uniref:glucan 1,3-beta-glucosidase n=1 Tax=Truncatella angustata TaxID=152316 RepID=A0A9P8UDJ2_9PEZI|nr:glycoside hydrolase superfamily [Truncatella angustata]KAH6647814.1 glycoside hydrolase superfamily [Truncatella angustata]